MPYGYGQQNDPTEMSQLSGNPFYNPYQPGPDFVRGLQYLYANLQGAKDKKKSEQQAEEDRQWSKMVKTLELELRKQQIESNKQAQREYETPEQRSAREAANRNLEHTFRLEEIDRANSFKDKVATSKDAEDEAKLAAAELRRLGMASKVERAQRQKKHKELRTQIEAIDRRLLALTKQYSSAQFGGDALLANSTKSEMDRITTQKEMLDAEMYNLSADVIGGPEAESIPPDILAAAKKARPDLSDEEIIKAWRAKKK